MSPAPGGPMSRSFLSDEEKAAAPKITGALIKRILKYLKPYWLQFTFVFLAILIAAVIGLFPSIITGKIVDQALVGEDLMYLVKLLLIALATMLTSQLIGVLENYINSWIAQHIIFDMKNEMYEKLQYMPHAFFTTEKQGDVITRMNTDISGVSSVISGTLSKAVSNIATVITTLVALFTMSWQLALVGLAVLPLLILPTRSAGKVRLKLLKQTQAKNDEINQMINETLSVSGSLLVKMFTREKKEIARFRKVNKEATDLAMKETRSGAFFNVIMGMFSQLGPLLIYFAGGYFIISKLDPTLTVGTITAMVALVNRLYRPVESLLNLHVSFTRSLALFDRIFDYLDRENNIVSPENGAKPDVTMQPIVYDHVAFSYDGDKRILTDVNFTVPGGKMYAIVGPSGSGKSTVVNLIPRLYDVTDGAVRIAGVDVRDFDLPYLRQCVGTVTQETYLFNGTILENLRYGKEDATMEEIEEACRIANIHDFILAMPDGYETQVGNRGLKLSGGEKQRISLARVILKDPRILILDEATSALDSISEKAIQDALEKLMVGRTSIVIAHRLSTILKADRILVVKDGVIAEQGTHDELLAAGGVYHELYETQFRQVIEHEREGAQEVAGVFDLDIQALGTDYDVRRITEADIADVYMLARANRRYYMHLRQRPSMARLTEVISDVPEGASDSGKYFVGFYGPDADGNGSQDLVAIMDLICGYPQPDEAFIGWFMVDVSMQGQGVGTQIFADVRAALAAQGFKRLELTTIKGNEEAMGFWKAQGFEEVGDGPSGDGYETIRMARDI
ncbi:MAG: GNAT family N-acetyltransferase [Coriobacteriales bacterium]|nr:GNAT family N-acetyltransferase [Coriobacteriales bacterium]